MSDPKAPTLRRAKTLTVALVLLLALGAGRIVFIRMSNAKQLEAGTAERAQLYVRTAKPRATGAGQTLNLPGTLQGYVQAPIAARASGYLRVWKHDIGSRVAKGELLAELDTPEIDQQLSQAIAARQQAAASVDLTKSTLARWEALRAKDAVSQQELDERRSADGQARANLAAAEANVERLRQLEGFKRVVAPFSGVITRRNVDVGDLVDAGGGAGRAMFILSQTDPLRVYVNVPQSYAHLVKPGQRVEVVQAELREQAFTGQVVRTAGAIDTGTRTLQVEVNLPNKDGSLLPGAFVQVALPLAPSGAITVPANALMIRAEGTRLAVLDAENRVRLRPVKVGRNYGQSIEVLEGVSDKDVVVLNPPDSLVEGDKVSIAAEPPKADAKGDGKAKGDGAKKKGEAK